MAAHFVFCRSAERHEPLVSSFDHNTVIIDALDLKNINMHRDTRDAFATANATI